MPIPLPDLSHLSNTELSLFRGVLATKAKEARKDSVKAIGKSKDLKALWLKSVSVPGSATPEERAAAIDPFHQEILKNPEEFLVHAWTNALWVLDQHVREEMLKRSRMEPLKIPKR